MSSPYRSLRRVVIFMIVITSLIRGLPAFAQPQPIEHLIPIGGGYSDIYAGFAKEAVANARNGQVNILVLPMAYSTNAETITDTERATNLQDAEERRFQIEEACKRAAPENVTCAATLAPIFTRSDAENPDMLKLFTDDLAAIFILGGDQTIAMQVITDTPIEETLAKLYESGVIVAGTSAGGGMQSAAMLAGYHPNFAAGNSLQFGASDVWNTPEKHGLLFSIKNAILEQHFFERGRLGRLLNAIVLPDVPHVGIGVDAYTGVNVYDETRLQDVFGLYTTTILDAETYHAADAVEYSSPDNLLRLRNVLVQMLSPGKFSYDLAKRVMSIGTRAQPPRTRITRDFKALTLPRRAGPLILAGDLSEALQNNAVLKRFVELSGGDKAKIMIVAAGFPSPSTAQVTAEKYAAALGVPSQTVAVPNQDEPLTIPDDVTGLLLIADDQSKVVVSLLDAVKTAWANGLPLLADNGGAAVAGRSFSAHGPTPQDADEAEFAVQKSFLQGTTNIIEGLGLLDVTIEPQLLNDNRWGRLFSLAYNAPGTVAFGLAQNTALEITQEGVRTIGDNVIFALDLRNAARDLGTNDGFVIANGLLDVFVPGDPVRPSVADVRAAPTRMPTPILPTNTPTPTPTATSTNTATPAPTPTAAPTATIIPTATPTPIPTAVPFGTSPTGGVLPILPITIGAAVILFVVVLLAGRRRK
ncbi:MAG: cyanophycinase [Chloroflexi bacterium]|nr:cyanophycinase [Chloroflexota bacterium]